MRAAREVESTSSTLSSRARSMVTAHRSPSGTSTPPTTDEPPPYGTATTLLSEHHSSVADTSASVRESDKVGRVGKVSIESSDRVDEALAIRVRGTFVRVHGRKGAERARRLDAR